MGSPVNHRNQHRRGLSLLEVIVCTGLVAVMMVPVASVIRASGQTIQQAGDNGSIESSMRTSLRWISDSVHDGTLVSVQNRRLRMQLPSGDVVTIEQRGNALVSDDGGTATALMDDVRSIRFSQITQTSPPNNPIGVTIDLVAIDPTTRNPIAMRATVSLPPQK